MYVEAYILAFNEAETIHLTVKHYQQFCDRICIYDNFSTDNTRDICDALGCEIRPFGMVGVLDDKEYLKIKNHCWKGSKADWAIVCDADEILQITYDDLLEAKGTIFRTNGFNIFSNEMPVDNWSEIMTGLPDIKYSKQILFDPQAIKEINYQYGCHEFAKPPHGEVVYCDLEPTLFHYKHIGGPKRVADRHALYASRLSDFNRKWKLGFQYNEPREKTIKYFNECLKNSLPYSQDGD